MEHRASTMCNEQPVFCDLPLLVRARRALTQRVGAIKASTNVHHLILRLSDWGKLKSSYPNN